MERVKTNGFIELCRVFVANGTPYSEEIEEFETSKHFLKESHEIKEILRASLVNVRKLADKCKTSGRKDKVVENVTTTLNPVVKLDEQTRKDEKELGED